MAAALVKVLNIEIGSLQKVVAYCAYEYTFVSVVLVGITFLIVVRRLKNHGTPTKLLVNGITSPGFEDVRKAFQDILDYGWEQGGSFAVYYKGKQVVNLWGGYADPDAGPSEWREDTLGRFFSCTKGVSAICLAKLADEGLIDYDEKVSTYWPEFGQNGKERITVKQLVSHQGGVAHLTELHSLQWQRDDYPRLRKILEEQPPLWSPGKKFGYHTFTHGMYIDELIRRVDPKCRSLQQFFKEEVADAHGLDFHIGLPLAEAYRMSRLGVSPKGFWVPLTFIKFTLEQTFGKAYLKELIFNVKDIKKMESIDDMFNNPYLLNVGNGSVAGCGTADSLAKFYSIVMGKGGTFLSKSMIEALQKPVVSGQDEVLGFNWTWGLGTCLFRIKEDNKQYFAVGSAGHGGQIGFADTTNELGVAFVSRCLWPFGDAAPGRRYQHLLKALYSCILQMKVKSDARIEFTIIE